MANVAYTFVETMAYPGGFDIYFLDVSQAGATAPLYVAALPPHLLEEPFYFIVYLSHLEVITIEGEVFTLLYDRASATL